MTADPIDFLTAQRRRTEPTIEDRAALGETLTDVAQGIVTNRLAIGNAYAVAVVVLTDNGPAVLTNGIGSWDDIRDVERAMGAYYHAKWEEAHGKEVDIQASVSGQHRRHYAGLEAAKKQKAQYEAANPWMCDYCERRYKTERGAVQHERKCWKNPQANQYRSGQYTALQIKGGKAHGWAKVIPR